MPLIYTNASSASDDVDPEALISRLAGPLSPPDRIAFRRAAEDTLTRVPCWGEGVVYRVVASLQRAYFTPPDVQRTAHDAPRRSKLVNGPPIGRDDPRSGRRRLKPVG